MKLNKIKTMETTVKPQMTVLSKKVRCSMKDLMGQTHFVKEMYQEAAKLDFHVTGCSYWVYTGCNGDMNAEFDLEFIIPIQANGKKGEKFEVKTIPPYKCVTYLHHGSWMEFHKVYENLMKKIQEKGLKLGKSNREMYLNCDFEDGKNCLTEIQIEIE